MADVQLVEQLIQFLFATRAVEVVTILEDGEDVLFNRQLAEDRGPCGRYPRPIRARLCIGIGVKSRPSSMIRPLSALMSPTIM